VRSLAQFERPPELWVVTRAPRPSTAASCQAPGPIAFPYSLRIQVHYPERPAGGSQVRAQLVGAKPKDRSSPYGTPKGLRSPLASPLVTDPQQARARGPRRPRRHLRRACRTRRLPAPLGGVAWRAY